MTKLAAGDVAPTFVVGTLHGATVTVPARELSYGKHADDQWSFEEIIALARPPSIGTVDTSLEGRRDR